MTRLAIVIAVLALAACNKPSEDSCRQALANMQRLLGTENIHDDAKMEGEVRRCKGGSTKKAVECAIKAQTLDDLQHCNFHKGKLSKSDLPPTGSGSAAPAAGSAAGSGRSATPAAGSGPGSQ